MIILWEILKDGPELGETEVKSRLYKQDVHGGVLTCEEPLLDGEGNPGKHQPGSLVGSTYFDEASVRELFEFYMRAQIISVERFENEGTPKPERLALKKVPGKNLGFQLHGAPTEYLEQIKRIVSANHMDDPDYIAATKANPFVQGYDETDGWIFIEFWSNQENASAYIDYLNNHPELPGDVYKYQI